MIKNKRWIIGLIALFAIVSYLAVSPVIFRVPFFKEHNTGEPMLVLFNPFRSRVSERVANDILLSIKNGHCEMALRSALDMTNAERSYVCEMVSDWGLSNWQLRNRTDSSQMCKLYFWHQDSEGLWVVLRKSKNGWQLSYVNVIY